MSHLELASDEMKFLSNSFEQGYVLKFQNLNDILLLSRISPDIHKQGWFSLQILFYNIINEKIECGIRKSCG